LKGKSLEQLLTDNEKLLKAQQQLTEKNNSLNLNLNNANEQVKNYQDGLKALGITNLNN